MSSRKHKKPDLKIIILAIAAVAAFSVFTISCSRNDTPQKEKRAVSSPSSPLMDLDIKKVVPVEELDVDRKDPQALSLLVEVEQLVASLRRHFGPHVALHRFESVFCKPGQASIPQNRGAR